MWTERRRSVLIGVWLVATTCGLQEDGPAGDVEASALQQRGKASLLAGDLAEAERDLRRAFERHRSGGDHANAAIDAIQLMKVHGRSAAYRVALQWGDVAHAEAVASEEDALIGDALRGLLDLLQMVDESAASEEMLAAAQRFTSPDDLPGQISLRVHRALKLRADDRLAEATQLQAEALRLAREAGEPYLVQIALINLADLALERHRLDDAERHLAEAREIWKRRKVPPSEGLLVNEAILARERGRLDEAVRALDALADGAPPDTMWTIHWQRGVTAERAGRPAEAERWYRSAIDVVETLRAEAAPVTAMAAFFERRWLAFEALFALQLQRRDVHAALDTLLRAQGRMFLDALARAAVPPSSVEAPAQGVALFDRVTRLGVLASSPLAEAGGVDYVLAAQRDRYVLVYFMGADRLRALAIENGEPRITSVDVPRDELARLVSELRAHPDDEWVAAELGAALLPGDAIVGAPGRIHIVPTGPLLKVSFAALIVSGLRVLDRFEVAYAPSLTSLAVDRRFERSDGRAVVMADRRLLVQAGDRELAAVVQATGATSYLDGQATTASLRGAARAEVLHIITHSGVNPSEGYLALDDDQEVTAADILAWRMRPRLVVLPTCASAATRRTEMWGSLAAAFLASGSEHVVATLRAVPNADASAFSEAFYRLGGARDPVAGLARAQREMAATRPVSQWMPFVVAGP